MGSARGIIGSMELVLLAPVIVATAAATIAGAFFCTLTRMLRVTHVTDNI